MQDNRDRVFRPRLERLEDRQCPSVTPSLTPDGRTLTVQGDRANDVVRIVQDDASGVLSVTAPLASGAQAVYRYPSARVTRLVVNLGEGHDEFHYATRGAVRHSRDIVLHLGGGDDTARIDWAGDRGVASAGLSLFVSGGAGDEALSLRTGRLGRNASVAARADLGSGDDGAAVQSLNPTSAEARLSISVAGGTGDDELVYSGSGDLARRAVVDARLDGQAGDDVFRIEQGGRIDGVMRLQADGGAGGDQADVAVTASGGTGWLFAGIEAGAGDDGLRLLAVNAGDGPLSVNARANGGAGTDVAVTTAGVAVRDVEVSLPADPAAALRAALETARAAHDVPALAGGVIVAGELAAAAATGVIARGHPGQVRDGHSFHLGSNGKAMTSTLAAILVERGRLRWDSTLSQVFPELRGKTHPAYAGVTLEQLLNHRSGLVDDNVSESVSEQVEAFRGPPAAGRRLFLAPLLNTPPGVPGEMSYSNAGYTVAAALMERVTGQPFEAMMKAYVFDPLGMTSAGFGPPGAASRDQPQGHDEAGGPVGYERDLPALMAPAGLMHMNMADWAKFLRVHLGQAVNGVRLLSEASLTKLHTPDPRPVGEDGELYGFGWLTIQTPLGPALWHDGSNGFWYSGALLLPSRGAAVFAAASQAGEPGAGAVQEALAALQQNLAAPG